MLSVDKKNNAKSSVKGILLMVMVCVMAGKAFGEAKGNCLCPPSEDRFLVHVGTIAPGFSLKSTDGKTVSLDQYHGSAVLLSFIDIRDFKQFHLSEEIRSQLAFLRSIYRQYEKDGLTIILIDAPGLRGEKATDKDVLNNFKEDNEVRDWPLLSGKAANQVAARYGVRVLPTTMLVNRKGVITQVWEHLALSGQLALAVENIPMTSDSSTSWDTPSQTIFPGFGPARKLSSMIWIADGGRKWKRQHYPIRLLALDNRARRIRLTIINKSGEELLVNAPMEKLDEGRVLLHNMPGVGSSVYSVPSVVSLREGGRYELKAIVFDKDNHVILQGAAHITVADE